MHGAIEAMTKIIASQMEGEISPAAIARVLSTLLELRREYAEDSLAFEDRYSPDHSRFSFDRRSLVFLQGEPAAGVHRMRDGGYGGRMS